MSHIIDRLKKLEKTVMNKPELPNLPRSHTSRAIFYSGRKSVARLILVFLALIVFGITGYIAGVSSRKGDVTGPEGRSEIAVAEGRKNQSLAAAEGRRTVSEVMTEDSRTTITKRHQTTAFVPPMVRKDTEFPLSEDHPAAEQGRLILEKSGKSESEGGSDRVAALASAIIKATDEPITDQEELMNKETILKLNILGVVEEDDGMVAIISGESYREGDNIAQFTVEEITSDYVIFSFKKKLYRKLLD